MEKSVLAAILGGFLIVFVGLWSWPAAAAPNLQINYQGKLTDSDDVVVADGNHCLELVLFDAASGGNELWSEEWQGSTSYATTTRGIFSLMLGTHQSLSNVNFNQALYLQVNYDPGCDGTYEEVFSPRKALGTVPAAFEAVKISGLGSSQFLRSDAQNATSTTSTFVTITQSGSGNALDVNAGGGLTFTVTGGGLVGIATSTPVSTLSVQGSLCVRSTGSCGTTAGTIYTTNAVVEGIDLAENYPTLDKTLAPGEIVSLDPRAPAYIKRAEIDDGSPLLGVVSTAPGLRLGFGISGKPVALAGRVPMRVNLEGGEIVPGDYLTLSRVPGVGKKATPGESIVGLALEPFPAAQSGGESITVFLRSGWLPLSPEIVEDGDVFWPRLGSLNQWLGEEAGPLDFSGHDLKNIRSLAGVDGRWSIDGDGRLTASEVQAEELCLDEICLNAETLRGLLDLLSAATSSDGGVSYPVSEPADVGGWKTSTAGGGGGGQAIGEAVPRESLPEAEPVPTSSPGAVEEQSPEGGSVGLRADGGTLEQNVN